MHNNRIDIVGLYLSQNRAQGLSRNTLKPPLIEVNETPTAVKKAGAKSITRMFAERMRALVNSD